MCGIVGYVGDQEAVPILIGGLAKLEYRGYDSAGIAVLQGDKIEVRRSVGKLANLQKSLKEKELNGTVGIGHTRWATHGKPSEQNAHPHRSKAACSFITASSKIISRSNSNWKKMATSFIPKPTRKLWRI